MATAPRKDIPNPSAPNWGPRVTEELRVLMGRVGNGRALTATDLISAGIAKPGVGGGLVPGGPSSGGEADLTPPPMPTGVTVAAGLTTVLVEHDAPVYSQGHGHDRTVVYGVLQTGDTPPTFDQAVMLFQFQGNIGAYPAAIGTRYRLWLKWMSVDGVQSAAPAGGTNGLDVQTGKIGNNDLGPLIVEAQNLADGAISGSKLAADSIDATKFAQGIEPVTIVDGPELPAEKRTTNISWSGALYTWNGERYKAAALGDISFTQINGLIIADQIAEGILTTAKFAQGLEPVTIAPTLPSVKSTTNVVFNNELYTWDGTKYSKSVKTTDLAGTITAGQIAAGAIDVTKFASGLEPVEIVASLPGSKTTTNVVFGGELYTWSGTAYSKAVKAADITGQLIAAQIAVGAIDATKFASGVEPVNIVGTLPTVKSTSNVVFNNELYTWNGTAYSKTVKTNDLVGTISTSQIAAGAIDVTKFASGLEPVSVVASLPGTKTTTNVVFGNELYTWNGTAYSKAVKAVDITGQLLAAQIAAGAIDATKFASGIEPITVVTVLPTVKGTTNVVFNNELYTWNGTVYSKAVKTTDLTGTIGSAQIAPGAIDTSKLANGAVDAAKFASGIEPVAVVMVLPTVKSTANVVFGNELYTWNGTAYSKAVKAVDITGQLLAAQIAAGAIDATKFASGIEPVSVVGSLPGTKTTSNVVFNNELYTWNGTVYSKAVKAVDVTGQLTNAQIADIAAAKLAGQIVGTQISDLAISTPKLAAGAVVADKIAANAIVADKINANAVTTAKIATGAVTATEIAANAVTADKIIANAVTTAKIAAGAVTAAEIAAGAVTTAKLVVTDTNAVNIDPYFQDEAAWTIGSTSVTTVALAAGAVNSKAWTSTVVAVAVNPQRNKIDSSKSYLLEVWMRDASAAGNGAQFLQFHFYNAAGAIIAGTAGTGWPSINGNNHYFPGTNTQPAVTWTRYTLTMGPDGTAQIPAAAVEYTIGGWFNYNATVLTAQWFGAIRITEMARGELIVDGAITADKISANAITAGKIAAGSITATQLATNSVTADKIIANAVTTAKIATGAVTANEVAAKTITADKLVIGNSANLLADPTFDAGRGWAVGASFAYSTTTTGPDGSSAVKPVMLVTPQGPDVSSANADWGGFTLPAMTSVAAGSRFRYTMTARVVSGTAGSLRLRLLELAPGLANSWPILINLNGTSANGQWVTLTAERDLPADRTHMTVQLQANGAVGTVFEVAEVSMRQMATGELIVDGAITADKIAANSVTAAKIVAGTITATELATNSVTTIKIAANAVTATEIAANAITVDKIIANAVTTAKIATGAVTANEIAANAITAAKIVAGTITATELATNSVTTIKIAASAVTATEIAANAVTADKIIANAVTTAKIAAGAVTADQIAANAITAKSLVLADFTNLWMNPNFENNAAGWIGLAATIAPYSGVEGKGVLITATGTTAAAVVAADYNQIIVGLMACKGGEKLSLSGTVTRKSGSAAKSGQMQIQVLTTAGTSSTVTAHTQLADGDNPTDFLREYTFPANAVAFRLRAQMAATNVAGDAIALTNISVRRVNTADLIVDGAITANKIAVNAVTAAAIAAGTITAAEIATNAITADKIIANAVTTAKIATGAVTANEIAANAITAAKIVAGTITATELATNSVTTVKIVAGAVTATEIATNAITADKIIANAVTTAKIATGAVTANEIAANAVTAAKIVAGTITATELATNSVTTIKIAANAVTATEIAANAITVDKIIANAVTTAKIATGAVTANEIAVSAIIADKVATNAITADKIIANAVTTAKIATNAVTANEIAAGTITAANIAANAITSDKIIANAITTAKIAVGAVSADQIAANAITVKHLTVMDYSNIVLDPFFQDANSWITFNGTAVVQATSGVPAAMPGPAGFQLSKAAAQQALSRNFQASPGDVYHLSAWVSSPTTTGLAIRLQTQAIGPNGTEGGTGGTSLGYQTPVTLAAPAAINTWQKIEGFVTMPAGAAFARARVISETGTAVAGSWFVTNFVCRRAASANLIVDGAITANKLAANSIAAGTAAIQDGAIVNAMIGNLSADKITAGTLAAARIGAGVITASHLASNSVTTAKIAANAVTANEISVTALSAIAANIGTVTAGRLQNAANTQYLNLSATGVNGFLVAGGLSILANGTSTFSGSLSAAGGTFAGALSAATGTFSGNLSAAGGTFAGALSAATGTFSGSLTASAVNAVNTVNIAGDAITVPVTVRGKVASINMSTAGRVTVFGFFSAAVALGAGAQLRLYRNGSVIYTSNLTLGATERSGTAIAIDNPGAGVHTYEIDISDYTGSFALLLLGTKR